GAVNAPATSRDEGSVARLWTSLRRDRLAISFRSTWLTQALVDPGPRLTKRPMFLKTAVAASCAKSVGPTRAARLPLTRFLAILARKSESLAYQRALSGVSRPSTTAVGTRESSESAMTASHEGLRSPGYDVQDRDE